MRGTNHLYGYAKNNPLIYLDMFGLECSEIDSVTKYKLVTEESVVDGDWIYSDWQRYNAVCWCIWYRDQRIDVTETETWVTYKALECTTKNECGDDIVEYKLDSETDRHVKEFSKYGGRETRFEMSTVTATGEGVESGNDCLCRPTANPNPPGFYGPERIKQP